METFELNNLPEEILEKIFSFTSPYRDYGNISLVCKKWNRIMMGVRNIDDNLFKDCFENGDVFWNFINKDISPTQRHSHSACRLRDRLYIFGGLSNTCTSYNDLWSLDLNNKAWHRLVTDGQYPSPKAASSLVAYKNTLVLYGGYSHPFQHPLNQQVNFFDELHVFCTQSSTWHLIVFSTHVPKLAGHTASVINKNQMVMFGGCDGALTNKTNSVYCLCLDRFQWIQRSILGVNKPDARYGHSQLSIDDERILIVGGCGGPNNLYDDIWLLLWPMDSEQATWQRLIVNQSHLAPIQLHCVSVIQCGEKLVTLGKPKVQAENSDSKRTCTCLINGTKSEDTKSQLKSIEQSRTTLNTNLKQKALNQINMHLNKSERNKIKRLEVLENIAHRYSQAAAATNFLLKKATTKNVNNCKIHSKLMQIFILDIKNVLTQPETISDVQIEWLEPISNFQYAPNNTILYSLTSGINEIILFGGMEIDSNLISTSQYNSGQNQQGDEKPQHKVTKGLYLMKAIKA